MTTQTKIKISSPAGYVSLGLYLRLLGIIGPWHEISNNVVCAPSQGSDQPAHKRRLIRAFAGRLDIL